MRRLVPFALVVSLLVVGSTALLAVQAQRAAEEVLLGRGLDRASAMLVAVRSAPLDDGVLGQMAQQLVQGPVLRACVFAPDGRALCPGAKGLVPVDAPRWVSQALARRDVVANPQGGVGGVDGFDLWLPLDVGAAANGAARLAPGPVHDDRRVLWLVLDPTSARQVVTQTLLHAVLVTVLLAILLGVLMRQSRLDAREKARAAELAADRRFAELGRLSAVLAHEIRNPLGAIKGFAQFTAKRFAAADPAREDMETIVAESTRLEGLVESLLIYARPRALVLQSVEVCDLVDRQLRLVEQEAAEHGVRIRCDRPAMPVHGEFDAEQLGQALLNVLRNGVQAMAQGGGELRIAARATTDDRVEIEVADQGPGIAQADLPEVFEPYFTRKARGTGLGLAVTRRVVHGHGGEVRIASSEGGGATVVFDLPLHGQGRDPSSPKPSRGAA